MRKLPAVTAAAREAISAHSVIVERGGANDNRRVALARTELVATVQAALGRTSILCVSGPAGLRQVGNFQSRLPI